MCALLVVGLFDILSSGRAAATDPAWPSPYKVTYLFVGLISFGICFGIARYSVWLERRMAAGQAKIRAERRPCSEAFKPCRRIST